MTAPVIVQAKDGRWVFGQREDEEELRATQRGHYDTAADASEAATKAATWDREVGQ